MAFLQAFLRYLVNRLNERSSWAVAVPLIAGAIGMRVSPDVAETIGTIATSAALALPALLPDGDVLPPNPKAHL